MKKCISEIVLLLIEVIITICVSGLMLMFTPGEEFVPGVGSSSSDSSAYINVAPPVSRPLF